MGNEEDDESMAEEIRSERIPSRTNWKRCVISTTLTNADKTALSSSSTGAGEQKAATGAA